MCRAGGRRCPSYSDPVAIAARNARRRAAYKAKKETSKGSPAKISQMDNTMSEKKKEKDNISELSSKYSYSYEDRTYAGSELLRETGKTSYNDDLKITKTELTGFLTDNNYFQPQRITGVIDGTKLNKKSYLEFGFDEIKGNNFNGRSDNSTSNRRRSWVARVNGIATKNQNYVKLSTMEMIAVPDNGKQALENFTSSDFKIINSECFTPEKSELESYDECMKNYDNGCSRMKPQEVEEFYDGTYEPGKLTDGEYTKEYIQATINYMDEALQHGPKQQRVVYRGVRAYSPLFKDCNNNPCEWIDNEMPLGSVIEVEGFNSASMSASIAAEFSGDNGVLYEILTPEGANITKLSNFKHEREVLLPRKQKYMIVGVHKKVTMKIKGSVRKINVVQMVAINSDGAILDGTNSDKIEKFETKVK